jgi:uncharacterized phage protein (predicted DNA packaging)
MTLLEKVKKNLIISHDVDDDLIQEYINAAVKYAETFQHQEAGYYDDVTKMNITTEQGVIMLASHFYESRDGSTAGFFADNVQAGDKVWETVNRLLTLDKSWKF